MAVFGWLLSKRSIPLVALGVGAILLPVGCRVSPGPCSDRSATRPLLYSQGEIEKHVESATGIRGGPCARLARDSSGHRLYCYRERDVAIVSSGGRVTLLSAPGLVSFLDDQGHFVAWTEDARLGVVLRDGSRLSGADFLTDPGGNYYSMRRDGVTSVGRLNDPSKKILTSPLAALALFERDGVLYLFGHGNPDDEIAVEVYRLSFGEVTLTAVHRIRRPAVRPSPFVVVDFDPESQRVLLLDTRDVEPADWLLHDLRRGESCLVGRGSVGGLFLRADVIGTAHGDIQALSPNRLAGKTGQGWGAH